MGAFARCIWLAAALAATPSSGSAFDIAHVTCRSFLAAGHDNMAAIIMWLRGYHAGRGGRLDSTDKAQMRSYGGRLGHYCKEHPDIGVIDASERVLLEEDRGI